MISSYKFYIVDVENLYFNNPIDIINMVSFYDYIFYVKGERYFLHENGLVLKEILVFACAHAGNWCQVDDKVYASISIGGDYCGYT